MGLSSVTNTAFSGIQAATRLLDVTAHNLANSQTPGFKVARLQLATQGYQTLNLGVASHGPNSGANPRQLGLGVAVAAIDSDTSSGTIEQDQPLPLLALDGEGLFLLEGPRGERWYTRNGSFRLNAAGELTTSQGYRVLGHTLNDHGRLDVTTLSPIAIHLGEQAASPSTGVAKLEGFNIGSDGRVVGRYSDGIQRTLGQIRIARFANPQGLYQRANNLYEPSPAAGLPLETNPGADGAATIHSAAIERSNVDVGRELIHLALARTQFRANLLVAATWLSFWEELLNLQRSTHYLSTGGL